MTREQKSERLWRYGIYAIGVVILSIGLTLNTKTGLGTSPVISVSFSIAQILDTSFPLMNFFMYAIFVALQFLLKGKNREWIDLLQIPFSIVFSVLLDVFGRLLDFHFTTLWQNLLLLLAAMILTAIGVACMVNMHLVANPADGFANTLGMVLGKGVGFGKNVQDIACVILTCVVSLACTGHIIAIGIGTLIAMIGVGRFIALFQHFFKEKMLRKAGML